MSESGKPPAEAGGAVTIKIRNFRGVHHADVECSPLALVAGANFEGKSSFCQAAAAAITGQAMAGFDIPQKEASTLVCENYGDGHAMSEIAQAGADGGGKVMMTWPECRGSTTGAHPPRASIYAVGLASLAILPAKERAQALERYLRTTPDRHDLEVAFADKPSWHQRREDKPSTIDKLWGLIERDGWDRVHADQIKERGKTAGAWEQATGGNFGSQKAKAWVPEDWDPMLLEIGEETLAQNLADDETALEQAIGATAVNRAERERLTTLAARVADLVPVHDGVSAKLATCKEELAAAQQVSADNATSAAAHLPCPHCGEPIELRRDLATTTLVKAITMDKTELNRRRKSKAEADGLVSKLTHEQRELERELEETTKYLTAARDAKGKLEALDPTMEEAGSPDLIRQRRDQIKDNLAKVRAYTEAQRLYRRWESYQIVIDALKPEGLRQKKLTDAIDLFNREILAPLCETARWAPVAITADDLGLVYNGRRYALLAESEQFRARVTVQVAQAKLDDSNLLIIDRADTLDSAGRNGLFRLLRAAELPAVIGMTISRREQAPDLAAAGLGRTYWIEGGTIAA